MLCCWCKHMTHHKDDKHNLKAILLNFSRWLGYVPGKKFFQCSVTMHTGLVHPQGGLYWTWWLQDCCGHGVPRHCGVHKGCQTLCAHPLPRIWGSWIQTVQWHGGWSEVHALNMRFSLCSMGSCSILSNPISVISHLLKSSKDSITSTACLTEIRDVVLLGQELLHC